MFIEILFKMLLFKGGVLIYAEHCIYKHIFKCCFKHFTAENNSVFCMFCMQNVNCCSQKMDVKTTDNLRLSCVKALHWLLLCYMGATLGSG